MANGDTAAETITPPMVSLPQTRLTAIPGGKPNLNAAARRVAKAAAAANQPVRLRLHPYLFLPGGREQYTSWNGVVWKMEFGTFSDVVKFREDLGKFVDQWFEEHGVPEAPED